MNLFVPNFNAVIMRAFVLISVLLVARPLMALTPNLPAGSLGPEMIVQTRLGPMPDCIVYAPKPRLPRGFSHHGPRAHGVYAVDLSVATGLVYSARILESSGDRFLDNVTVEALRQWRFKPRSIYKLIVPVDFDGNTIKLGAPR